MTTGITGLGLGLVVRKSSKPGLPWGIYTTSGALPENGSPVMVCKLLILLTTGLPVTTAPYRGDMPWRQSPLRGVPVAVAMRGAIR